MTDYKRYFKSLIEKHITSNKYAKCCICDNWHKSQLTIHHERYNIEHERLNRDLYIVCSWEGACHTQIHYLARMIKLPLNPLVLRKRRQMLRLRYCLTTRRLSRVMYSLGELIFS